MQTELWRNIGQNKRSEVEHKWKGGEISREYRRFSFRGNLEPDEMSEFNAFACNALSYDIDSWDSDLELSVRMGRACCALMCSHVNRTDAKCLDDLESLT